jgi:tRNA U34 5-methylaminomethyl-2-thiouridine-forming methyltransferase MnmC
MSFGGEIRKGQETKGQNIKEKEERGRKREMGVKG